MFFEKRLSLICPKYPSETAMMAMHNTKIIILCMMIVLRRRRYRFGIFEHPFDMYFHKVKFCAVV